MSEASKTCFVFKLAPYYKVLHDIKEGHASQIDPRDLASEIRAHGINVMPQEVVEFLCDHLDGKIEKRGRKGYGLTEKTLLARRAAMFYRAVKDAQHNPSRFDETFVEFIEECLKEFPKPIPAGEAAWRIVSSLLYGHDGHHKRVANLVSKHAPLKEQRLRKKSSRE